MSARYEITDNDASIRCQKPGKGPLILYACDHDSSTQKIIAVIRQLRADLAAVTAERDQLRAQLAEYVEAPVVAVVYEAFEPGTFYASFYGSVPIPGTELIARPKVKP